MTCSFIGNLFSIWVIFWTPKTSLFFWHSRKEKWWLLNMWVNCVIELNDGKERERERVWLVACQNDISTANMPGRRLASLHWPLKKSIRRPTLRRLETTRTCWPASTLMEYKLIGRSFVFRVNRSGMNPRFLFYCHLLCVNNIPSQKHQPAVSSWIFKTTYEAVAVSDGPRIGEK